mmetsp:Transcript_15880/g.52132  ORF Transcript_15880/g.52132 Transcript_15880/m.52132 type:complete len:271 (-) Transcript_15880:316-1128(-)
MPQRASRDFIRGNFLRHDQRVPGGGSVQLPQIFRDVLGVVHTDVLQGPAVHRADDLVIGQRVPAAFLDPLRFHLVLVRRSHGFLHEPRARFAPRERVHQERLAVGTVLGNPCNSVVVQALLDVLVRLRRGGFRGHHARQVGHGLVKRVFQCERLLFLQTQQSVLVPRRVHEHRVVVSSSEHQQVVRSELPGKLLQLFQLCVALDGVCRFLRQGQGVVKIKRVIEPLVYGAFREPTSSRHVTHVTRFRGVRFELTQTEPPHALAHVQRPAG